MNNLFQILFITAIGLIVYSYVLYPFIIISLTKLLKNKQEEKTKRNEPVTIIIAAFNEEKVIGVKLKSIFNSNFPLNQIQVLIGNDSSTDNTEEVVKSFQLQYPNVKLVNFKARTGKIKIINELVKLVKTPVVIFTDANVIFTPTTIQSIINPLNDKTVACTAQIIKRIPNEKGISTQEINYLNYENRIKLAESELFNTVIGIEGGCFSIHRKNFEAIPDTFNVDDFYTTLSIIKQKKQIKFVEDAICYEDATTQSDVEFKRKVRISTGNFQNLFAFSSLLYQFWRFPVFAYWSHKVIRWFVPFLLIISILSSSILALHSRLYFAIFFFQLILVQLAVVVNLFQVQNKFLKFISHFYYMNMALLLGFVNFCKGVKTNVWEPTKRSVE